MAALTAAAELLAALGHDVREETPPWREADLFDKFIAVWQVGPALHPVDCRAHDDRSTAGSSSLRERPLPPTTGARSARCRLLARRIVSFWSEVDVVVTPTLALPPVPIGWQEEVEGPIEQLLRNTEFTPFTAVANLTGQPAMSLPLHWSEAGLPIGVHAIGPPAGDALLLSLAAQIEAARPWRDRRPPVS